MLRLVLLRMIMRNAICFVATHSATTKRSPINGNASNWNRTWNGPVAVWRWSQQMRFCMSASCGMMNSAASFTSACTQIAAL